MSVLPAVALLEPDTRSFARRILRPHARQDVLPRAQADEECEWHQPNAQPKVRRDLGEGGLINHGRRIPISSAARRRPSVTRGLAEVPKPQPVIDDDQDAARNEERVGELDDGEMSQVRRIDTVARDTQECQLPRESIDQPQEDLRSHHRVDQASQQFGAEDRIFFHEFRQVVEARSDRQREETKAQDQAEVAENGEDVHFRRVIGGWPPSL